MSSRVQTLALKVLTLKGEALAEALLDALGREQADLLLSRLLDRYRGARYECRDLLETAAEIGIDLDGLIGDWPHDTALPGFIPSSVTSHRVSDDTQAGRVTGARRRATRSMSTTLIEASPYRATRSSRSARTRCWKRNSTRDCLSSSRSIPRPCGAVPTPTTAGAVPADRGPGRERARRPGGPIHHDIAPGRPVALGLPPLGGPTAGGRVPEIRAGTVRDDACGQRGASPGRVRFGDIHAGLERTGRVRTRCRARLAGGVEQDDGQRGVRGRHPVETGGTRSLNSSCIGGSC